MYCKTTSSFPNGQFYSSRLLLYCRQRLQALGFISSLSCSSEEDRPVCAILRRALVPRVRACIKRLRNAKHSCPWPFLNGAPTGYRKWTEHSLSISKRIIAKMRMQKRAVPTYRREWQEWPNGWERMFCYHLTMPITIHCLMVNESTGRYKYGVSFSELGFLHALQIPWSNLKYDVNEMWTWKFLGSCFRVM